MTESKSINYQYQKIISELQEINPNMNLEEIEADTEELLYNLFIEEIENLKLIKDISLEKLRRKIIKQKLQSTRQPTKLRKAKYESIKKERKYFKLKKIQSSLKRQAFYNSLDYTGTFSKRELFYINHSDMTIPRNKFYENLDKYSNQEIYSIINLENKSSLFKKEKINDFNEIGSIVDFPEIQDITEIFRKIKEEDEKFKEDESLKDELEIELRKRILNLKLNPIEKKESQDVNLLGLYWVCR